MNVYLNTETDFVHNGLGFLTDIISAKVTDNLNGDYSLTFEYKVNGHLSEYIQNENIVKCKVADGTYQLFIIKNIVKTFDSIQVSCKHIFYLLLDNFLEDVAPTNQSCQNFLNWMLERTNYKHRFKGYSDIIDSKSARYVRRNPVDAILGDTDNSMINLFGGELYRDNFDVHFNVMIGHNNGVKLIIGKNITGINITVDTNSIHTRIMPQGYDGLLLPEKYVDSPLINVYPIPKIYKVEFQDIRYDPEDENAFQDIEEAYVALKDAANELFKNGIDKPIINVKVDWIELSKTNEYKIYSNLEKVNLGDTITIDLLGITYITRVIKTIYNVLTDRVETFELGTPKANLGDSTSNIKKQIEKINPSSILKDARENATDLLIKAMGGYIYKTQNELFIMDTNDPKTASKVWRWNLNGLGYSKNGINGPYETAITQNGQIVADFITTGKLDTNLIEGYEDLLLQVKNFTDQSNDISQIRLTLNDIKSQIGSITDVTSTSNGIGQVNIYNVLFSDVLHLQIYPTARDLSYLYPATDLYPGEDIFPLSRDIIFEDEEEGTKVIYTLPCDLLFLNENVKDELVLDYDTESLYVIHRVGLNQDGIKYELEESRIEYFDYNNISLPDGNYTIRMPSFPDVYINIRALAKNIYTSQYATKVQLDTSLALTRTSILGIVDEKVELLGGRIQENSSMLEAHSTDISLRLKSSDFTKDAVIGLINNKDGTSTAKIEATNIDLTGYVSVSDIAITGKTIINGSNITTGTISASRLDSKVITTDNFSAQNINASKITSGTLDASRVNVTNLSASNITSGTLSCDRLSGGTISGQSISGGSIYGASLSGMSGNIGGWYIASSRLYSNNSRVASSIYSNGNFIFGGNYGMVKFDTNPVRITTADKLLISDSYSAYEMSSSNDTISIRAFSGTIHVNSNFGVYANNQLLSSSSSRKTKKNIKNLTDKQLNNLISDISNLKFYSYDYKKKYSGGQKNNYGFIIDEMESTSLANILHVTSSELDKEVKFYNKDDLTIVNTIIIQKLLKKINNIESEMVNYGR